VTGDFFSNLVTVFLGSGAAIAVAKIVFEYRKDRRHRIDAAEYLALQLAFQFEGYAIECAEKASDHRTAIDSGGHAGQSIGRVPELSTFPESDAYKLLDRSCLNDVLDFPQRCRMANEAAMFWWDVVGDHDCCSVAMEENTLEVGNRALEIARNLRKTYALHLRDLTFGQWNIEEYFSQEISRLERLKQKHEQADAALWASQNNDPQDV
jgi:cbb3-type cytochrome oxidase subunit 3